MGSDSDALDRRNHRMFTHLVEAGQWDRALALGPALLADDPEDWQVHAMMSLAALNADEDLKRARLHSEAALRLRPEDAFSHLLAARLHAKANRLLDAKRALLEALRLEPEDASLWQEFGWNCYHRGDPITATEAVAKARSLKPLDAGIENLATAVAAEVNGGTRLGAFEQIEGYERALRHDPENAWVMANIATVYLGELDDGVNAREWYQRALRIEPSEAAFRKGLHASIRRTDPVLRALNFPWNGTKRLHRAAERTLAKRPGVFLLAFPLWLVFGGLVLAALGLWMVFLYPPSKLYEWLTTEELMKRGGGVSGYGRGIHRWPYVVRLLAFLAITPVFFCGVWWFFTSPGAKAYHDLVIGGSMFIAIAAGLWWSAKRQRPV